MMKFDNPFSVRLINLDTFNYPRVEVVTWSSVFSDGGSVDVEAKTPEGTHITLYSEKIEENRDVSAEREYCEELAEEWNSDLEYNWDQEILRCLRYIAEYEEKQIAQLDEHKENLQKYRNAISRIEAKEAIERVNTV